VRMPYLALMCVKHTWRPNNDFRQREIGPAGFDLGQLRVCQPLHNVTPKAGVSRLRTWRFPELGTTRFLELNARETSRDLAGRRQKSGICPGPDSKIRPNVLSCKTFWQRP
jgi:hypothetical protein